MRIFSRWGTTFNSLENRDYRWFWLSSTFAATVMQMNLVARSWLVFDLTDSYSALGWVSFCAGVPLFILSPFGGAIADRFEKRGLIVFSQILMGLVILGISILIFTDVIEFWQLVVAALLNGVFLAFNLPSRQSLVPRLVERRLVMNAVALNSGSQNMNRIVAPAVAGVMISVIGMEGVYLLTAGFAFLSAALMLFVPSKGTLSLEERGSLRNEVREGLRYVRHNETLRALMIMAIIPIVFGMPYLMLLSGYAKEVLGVENEGFGGLLSMAGVGAVIGSIVIATMTDFSRKGWLLIVSAAVFGVFLMLFASTDNFVFALLLMMGVGLGNAGYLSVNNSLLLLSSEERMHGRVMSLYMMSIAIMPMAVLPMGVLSDVAGAQIVIGVGGALLVLFTVLMTILSSTLRRL